MRSRLTRFVALLLLVAMLLPLVAACSKKITYTVDFIVDEAVYHTVTSEKLEEIALPQPPAKEGSTFVGWFYDKDTWAQPFKAEELPTESKEKELKFTVYAYFTPNSTGVTDMADKFYFKLNEVTSDSITVADFSSAELVAENEKLSASITSEIDNVTALKWRANEGLSFKLPAELDLSKASVISFSMYSPAATNKTFQLRFNCSDELKGQNAMTPYYRVTFAVDFTGWKTFEFKTDTMNGNYSPTFSRIASINLDCSGWSLTPDSNTTVYIGNIVAPTKDFTLILPEGVTDPYKAEYYDGITAKYKELLIGKPEGSTTPEFTSKVKSIVNSCTAYWKTDAKSFEKTFVDVNTPDTLFGLDMSARTNENNVDEKKITEIYSKLLVMAEAYAIKSDENPYYHSAELLEVIKKGLEYTYLNYYGPTVWIDGVYGNWWAWDIGNPLSLTGILCILENELGYDLCKKYLEAFDYLNPLPNMTACNKVWITRCILLSAALQHDPVRILRSNLEVYDVFDYVTKGDGFYEDGSFVQHDTLAYTGGYGLSMLGEITNIMYFMHGSRFEWNDPDVANQYRWVFENFRPCVYNGNFMAAMRGREVSRNTSEAGAQNSVVVALIKMQSYAPDDIKPQLEALIRHYMLATGKNYAGNVPPCLIDYALQLYGNESIAPADDYYVTRVLGKMDRVVQHGPEYGVCIALSSTRITKYESINRENEKAWYTGDGMIYLYTDGYDYNGNYYNYADPYLMPGTTANSAERIAKRPDPHPFNSSPFAGGVELGRYGAVGFYLGYDVSKVGVSAKGSTFMKDKDAAIKAKKSYFIFDNEVVCLGTGISDSSGTDVRTVVENRYLRNGDTFKVNGETVTPDATAQKVDAKSMHFTNMGGYVYLLTDSDDDNVISYRKNVNGKYSFLEILITHKNAASGSGRYAYVYLPEATAEETEAYNANPDVTVIRRTTKSHAVVETKLGIMGCVFFEGDTVNNSTGKTAVTSVSARQSCAVMLTTNENGETVISISDPTQELATINLEVAVNASSVVSCDDGVNVSFSGGKAIITVNCTGNVGNSYSLTVK